MLLPSMPRDADAANQLASAHFDGVDHRAAFSIEEFAAEGF
jgi:hypothetical protein